MRLPRERLPGMKAINNYIEKASDNQSVNTDNGDVPRKWNTKKQAVHERYYTLRKNPLWGVFSLVTSVVSTVSKCHRGTCDEAVAVNTPVGTVV